MFVVAILELATPVEAAAGPLAADLGRTVYEARFALSVACDTTAVRSSSAMTSLRRFRIEDDAILAEEREKKFSVTRAHASGGVVMRKEVTQTSHSSADERERVLYLLRASGEPPSILREHEASYASLGRLAPTTRENFDATVRQIREHTRHVLAHLLALWLSKREPQ